ncbi:MAG: 16S rRNA (cytidine(1402)-2'-O)-methyltransferase [Minisyncoccales bacterium]
MATVYFVATPIGNLKDISRRALEVLEAVDLILCEDTRVTNKLLNFYQIKTPTLSYHQHSQLKKINEIMDLLRQGKNLAVVADAGTPGISDPGNLLIAQILKLTKTESLPVKIVPIPGPSAIAAAASVSGFSMDKFIFLGFPPTKKKRKKFFEELINYSYPVIFYESPYRVLKTLNELAEIINFEGQIGQLVVCRELTKKFETIYRGTIKEVINQLAKEKIKGELVIVFNKLRKK